MTEPTRRRVLSAISVAGAIGLAGCSGGSDGESGDDGSTADSGSGDTTTATYEYTFAEDDAVVGGSLTGLSITYPSGSAALADASLTEVLLDGGDVSRDIDDTSTANNGDTYTIDFAGNEGISAGDTLSIGLNRIAAPSGSYDVTITVNPQSGATTFTQSF
ncbi:DUF2808 domain-containing protein [Halonotius terrestris]|uniref:DUF2808 domain-containing protein n=1 Tax=Halonotius terrestris TaxID=2487750 RepID=A0A8J8P9I7_9EURY|nr:DUF2808 domain-containing protein [Halonotius terrestris]TQQ81236.1 DUF2808 domain-containing protein [Halonotius terrestris]